MLKTITNTKMHYSECELMLMKNLRIFTLVFIFIQSNLLFSQALVKSSHFNNLSGIPNRNPSITVPTDLRVNDLMIFSAVWRGGNNSYSLPTGYNLIRFSENGGIRLATFFKIATLSDTIQTSFNFTNFLAANAAWSLNLVLATNVDLISPIQSSASANAISFFTVSAPSLSISQPNTAVINVFAVSNNFGLTIPSGSNSLINTVGGSTSSEHRSIQHSSFVQPTISSTGTRVAVGGIINNYTAQSFSLNNAPIILPNFNFSLKVFSNSTFNKIQWQKFSEIEQNRFEIMKSIDGINWVNITNTYYINQNEDKNKLEFKDYDILNDTIMYYKVLAYKDNILTGESEIQFVYNQYKNVINPLVFPNPFSNQLNVQLEGEFTYSLKNIIGEDILKDKATDWVLLNISGFRKGVYYLEIISNSGQKWTQKIIKNE